MIAGGSNPLVNPSCPRGPSPARKGGDRLPTIPPGIADVSHGPPGKSALAVTPVPSSSAAQMRVLASSAALRGAIRAEARMYHRRA